MALLHIIAALLAGLAAAQPSATTRAAGCREWHECRQLALDARERGEYERFHDLAWRTVQTGPARDPMLMYLLARAQSLSGRPHDAFVMLGRLADMGVASDAATNDDFQAVRQLPDWPKLEAQIAAIGAKTPEASASSSSTAARAAPPASPGRSGAPAPSVSPAPPAATVAPAAPPRPGSPTPSFKPQDAIRLQAAALTPTGLAYDGASGRFVLGSQRERKLVVIEERSPHAVDLVRSDSAGFYDITALDIDPRRGDLWVASFDRADAGDGRKAATALHKLQLISGRPLATLPLSDQLEPARFGDVAVTGEGVVFLLDTIGRRIFRAQPQARTFAVVATLDLEQPTSIAPVDDHSIYVAHASGIALVDASNGMATPLRPRANVTLTGLERIRWARRSLVGIQQTADGSRRAVLVRVSGLEATAEEVVESDLQMSDPTAATVSGDEFFFLTRQPQSGSAASDLVVRRVRLR
jgi:hypothetical protein